MKNQDPQHKLEALQKILNHVDAPAFDLRHQEKYSINIRVDESVSPAMFKKDPLNPQGFIANSLTIRSMRNDVFVLGESLADFEDFMDCSCGKNIDRQL